MTKHNRIPLLLATAALVAASCSTIAPINAPTLTSGRADFSVVAAVGTGITAGFQSGGLVDRHQVHSYASLFAQQVGARSLDLPLIDGAGIPPLLEIKRLRPLPVQIGPINDAPGNPTNLLLPTAYHNLGVPGALLRDLTDPTHYTGVYFPLIERGRGSLTRQIAGKLNPPPTFLLIEYGSTELLGPALLGTNAGLMSTAAFADTFVHALDTLKALMPNVKMAVLNVPDVTSLPFFTTLSSKLLGRNGQPVLDANERQRFLLGPSNVALTVNDLILLTARPQIELGFGYPIGTYFYRSPTDSVPGNGIGLGGELVLNLTEAVTLQERARRFNGVIDTAAASIAVPRDVAVADFDGLLRRARTTGIELRRVVYTTAFVTGGLISLDGIYPNDLAQALLCNEVIEAVNAKFGSNIQPLDPLKFATLTASRASATRGDP